MTASLELVLPDETHLLPLTYALRAGWVAPPCPVRWVTAQEAGEALWTSGTVVLADPLAATAVTADRAIVADVAVAARFHSTVALLAAGRPDSLEDVELDARAVTGTTAALARILGSEHFGAAGWQVTRTPAADTRARLAEGDTALLALAAVESVLDELYRQAPTSAPAEDDDIAAELEPPAMGDAGYAEDLGRAWFVLTGLPWVSHVLLAPHSATETSVAPREIVAALRQSLRLGREQEATIVGEVAERLDLPERIIRRLFQARHYRLDADERKSLASFYQRAARATLPEVAIISVG